MTVTTTIVAGIEVPSVSPVFPTVVGFHVIAGIACVIAGMIAMFSEKRRGRHPTFGTIYYWCLSAPHRHPHRHTRLGARQRLNPQALRLLRARAF
jgi:hypothetical protein